MCKIMGKAVKPLTDRRRKKERIAGEINIEEIEREKGKEEEEEETGEKGISCV